MDWSIAAILAQDGLTTGAIYALLALALVLVFSVTRVIFIAQGEFVAFGALTLATLQAGHFPHTASLLVGLGSAAFLQATVTHLRTHAALRDRRRLLLVDLTKFILLPIALWLFARAVNGGQLPMLAQILLTLLIVVPLGPMLYRLAFAPLAQASTLVLLIVAVAVHLAMLGTGLLMFGPEGARTLAFSDAQFQFGPVQVASQSLLIIGIAITLIAVLYFCFERTLAGKALRATAINRLGAQLVGIGVTHAGKQAFTLAATLGVICGVLIAPLTTVYYDSGFLIGLKGFVGAIIGGLASYPVAAAGALLVGLLESYSSFWASAFKEVIVFTLILPVLLWRSLGNHAIDEEDA